MIVYRIVKTLKRANDLSGTGAYLIGGRWNNPGTYMLYTSENSSLAFLETYIHFEPDNIPPRLYIISLQLDREDLIYQMPEQDYPKGWMQAEDLQSKALGDKLMDEGRFLAVKVRSKINPYEYNYLLNPLFPGYRDLVKVLAVDKLDIDTRLL